MKNLSAESNIKNKESDNLMKILFRYSGAFPLLFVVILLILHQNLFAQQPGKIYGLTSNNIFSINSDGSNLLSSFPFADEGTMPQGEFAEGANGKLYGVTNSGGYYGFGIIYSVAKDGTEYTPLYDFNYKEGAFPSEGVTKCSDERFYGMTRQGGNHDHGVIFSIRPDGSDFSVIHHFNSENGRNPEGGILEGNDGKLYGVASGGGTHDSGVIFSVLKDGSGFKVLHNFNGTDGKNPYAKLLEGSDGKLYGSAYSGGANNRGLLFSISKEGMEFTILHQFYRETGSNPRASLIESSEGRLYGVTLGGGSNGLGTVLSLNKDGSNLTVLHNFVASVGYLPLGRIIEGSDGKLYGTTTGGCCYQYFGTIYSMSKDGMGYSILHNFSRTDGISPGAGLFEDGSGTLYGVTRGGGSDNSGVFFSINREGSEFSVLKSFKRSLQGSLPVGGLTDGGGGDDHFYGMTSKGGTAGFGVIFAWSKTNSEYKVIHNFDNSNAVSPQKNLIVSDDGNLYGVVGEDNDLFKISKDGTGYSIIYDFVSNSFTGNMLEGSDGKLYGTEVGSKSTSGRVFSLSKEGTEYTLVTDFSSVSSSFAVGGVAEGSDGKLYGVTGDGGANGEGVIYAVSKEGNDFAVLHNFNLANGIRPTGILTEGSDGKLYGMTKNGGVSDYGVIFSVTKDGSEFMLLHSFDGQQGMQPLGGLSEAGDGKLYGMTSLGGAFGQGVAFSLSKDGANYSILQSFDGTNGYQPQNSTLILEEIQQKQSQTISFPVIENKSTIDLPFSLDAYASSSLPVSFTSSNPSVATISGNEVTITGAGETEITALQQGDENYQPATPVSQILVVKNELTSIENLSQAKIKIFIYPNPLTSYLYIKKEGFESNQPMSITINDVTGCEVINLTTLEHQPGLDLRHLSSGIYYLRLVQGNFKKSLKFVKE